MFRAHHLAAAAALLLAATGAAQDKPEKTVVAEVFNPVSLDIDEHADRVERGSAGEAIMLIRMTLARIVIVDSEDEKMSMIVLSEVDGDQRKRSGPLSNPAEASQVFSRNILCPGVGMG